MKRTLPAIALLAIVSCASVVWARNTILDLPVAEARKSKLSGRLLDVPFFMAGEKHPNVARNIGDYSSNRRTNAFNKSDRNACHIAFLSAIIALQQRARAEGGNAVVDIRSVTRNQDLSNATRYRCAAGNVVANVALTGRIVTLAGK